MNLKKYWIRPLQKFNRISKKLVEHLVIGYQIFLSPFLGGQCRFYPSCSEYCLDLCRSERSLARTLILVAWRLMRCQPFGGYGFDPIPNESQNKGMRNI